MANLSTPPDQCTTEATRKTWRGNTAKDLADTLRRHLHELIDAIATEYDSTPSEDVTDPIFWAIKQADFFESEMKDLLERYDALGGDEAYDRSKGAGS